MLLAGFWHRNFSFINIYWKYLIDLVIGHGGPDDSVCVLIFSTISSFLFHLLLIFFCYSKTQFSISLIQTHNCLCWAVTIGRGTDISTHTNMNKLSSSKMPYHTTNYNYVSPERRKNHLKTHRNGLFLSWLKSRAFYGQPHWKKKEKRVFFGKSSYRVLCAKTRHTKKENEKSIKIDSISIAQTTK